MSKLIVNAYKHTGKWYTENITYTSIYSYDELFELENKIKQNHPDVWHYSGLINGFSADFNYVIKLEGTDFFMDFMLLRNQDSENEG